MESPLTLKLQQELPGNVKTKVTNSGDGGLERKAGGMLPKVITTPFQI
ncbi:MAG TPA: hypothetical protein VFF27_02055 [Bacteroidia bacterium]|nr:hypothetical protein [Bacteroidia bacterium]